MAEIEGKIFCMVRLSEDKRVPRDWEQRGG